MNIIPAVIIVAGVFLSTLMGCYLLSLMTDRIVNLLISIDRANGIIRKGEVK